MNNPSDAILRIPDFEYENNLFRLIIKNRKVWDFIRFEVAYSIVSSLSDNIDSKDFSTFHIIDVNEGECVAEYKGKIPPDRFAELLNKFGLKYNKALMCPENNSYGYATVLKLKELQYPNIYHKRRKSVFIGNYVPTKDTDVAGFTTSGKTRNLILAKLEEVLRNKEIKIYSTRFYDELKTFTWKNNKAQALKGHNDDLVISFAIAMWLYDSGDGHSRNTKGLNDAMLKAMKVTRNSYDDMPNAILEGRPHSVGSIDSKENPDQNKKRNIDGNWNKKLDFMKEWDWVYKS